MSYCDHNIDDYFEGNISMDNYCDDCKDIIADYETKMSLRGSL